MSGRVRSKLTYANVMATVGVFLALGGVSYAAFSLPKNSVGTKQLHNGAVTNSKLANGSVTGSKVRNGSLTGSKIRASTLGTVPNAAHANDADSLGGQAPSSFARANITSDGTANLATGQDVAFMTDGPLTFSASCVKTGGGKDQVNVIVTSAVPGVMGLPSSQAVLAANTPVTLLTLDNAGTAARSSSYSFVSASGGRIGSGTWFAGVFGGAVHAGPGVCNATANAVNEAHP